MEPKLSASPFSLVDHEVFLVTCAHNDQRSAFIATWVLPASLQENSPKLIILSSPLNFSQQLIEKSGKLNLHLIAADQADFLPRFGLTSGKDGDKFMGLNVGTYKGIPQVEHTCGWSHVQVDQTVDLGERTLIVGRVCYQEIDTNKKPLTKKEAFSILDPETVKSLKEKHTDLAAQSRQKWPLPAL